MTASKKAMSEDDRKNGYKMLARDYNYLRPKKEIYRQKQFFKKLIEDYSVKTCLDSSCGTGEHLIMLNGLGLDCSGSDLSSEMLSIARRNIKDKKIALKQEDFRRLSNSWKRKFDMVICMTTSFPHMIKDKDAVAALKSMYEMLNNRGVLVIDNGISDSLIDSKLKFIPARILKDRGFYFFLEYPNDREIVFNILQVKKGKNELEHTYDVIHYNAMRQPVLEKYFKETDFKKIHYYGDFDQSPYSKTKSKRLIAVAQK
jgi:ubiquinone/menaquinone biosynthesis C-methylase UbiE